MTLIKTLHGVASITHIVSAILVVVFANRLGWLIANEFATAVSHAVGVYLWWSCKDVNRCKQLEYTRRWIEYAVTAGLLEVAILDTDDVPRILTILTLNAVLQVFGWILDAREGMLFLLVVGFGVLGVEVSLIAYWSSKPVRTIVIYAFLYALFGVVQTLHKLKRLPYDEDHIYTLLSITTKVVLTWTLVAQERTDGPLETWVNVVGFAVLLVGGILLRVNTGRKRRSPNVGVDA